MKKSENATSIASSRNESAIDPKFSQNPHLSMCACLEKLANVYFNMNNLEEAYNCINEAYLEYT